MHHPDISNIILTIEDYFILLDDDEPNYSIKPTSVNFGNGKIGFGISISRQLLNGYIHAEISGEGRDDDTITFTYFAFQNQKSPAKRITIDNNNYSHTAVRDAIRIILKIDKVSAPQPILCE